MKFVQPILSELFGKKKIFPFDLKILEMLTNFKVYGGELFFFKVSAL